MDIDVHFNVALRLLIASIFIFSHCLLLIKLLVIYNILGITSLRFCFSTLIVSIAMMLNLQSTIDSSFFGQGSFLL